MGCVGKLKVMRENFAENIFALNYASKCQNFSKVLGKNEIIYNDGSYELTDTEITQRFEPEKIRLIEKFDPEKVITAVYLDTDKQQYNIKRFKIETTTMKTQFLFIKEGAGNKLEAVTTDPEPLLVVQTGRGQQIRKAKFKVAKMVDIMGWKAVGAKLTDYSKTIEMEWEHKAKEENPAPELF